MQPYNAIALQLPVFTLPDASRVADSRSAILHNIERLRRRIHEAKSWIGDSLQLVVTPEFLLTGFPARHSSGQWLEAACFDFPGREYDRLSEIALEMNIHLAGNAYERDPHFPELYFQTSYLIDPTGECVLRYRRLNTMWSASPHHVWSEYISLYGEDSLFPVANTAIGNFGAVASEEVLFPEVTRSLAMRGAEIFLHSTAEYSSPLGSPKETCKIARAIENAAYLISANVSGFVSEDGVVENLQGHSLIADPQGRLLAKAGVGDQTMTYASIDLTAVRSLRKRTGMENLLSRQCFTLYRSTFDQFETLRTGALENASKEETLRQSLARHQDEAIARLHQNMSFATKVKGGQGVD